MKTKSLYHGHRFPAVVISWARSLVLPVQSEPVWPRGIVARAWCRGHVRNNPLPGRQVRRCTQCAKAARRKPGSISHFDEMFVTLAQRAVSVVARARRAWRAPNSTCWSKSVAASPQQSAFFGGYCAGTRRRAQSLPTSYAVIRPANADIPE